MSDPPATRNISRSGTGANSTPKSDPKSDIVEIHWMARLLPKGARPYSELMRLDRPIGTWLLLLPGWWALALAAGSGVPSTRLNWWYFALFGLGAIVMRGAGCVVNDIVDRKFDAAVARTAARPIPSGRVSVFRALLFLAILAGIGLTILLQFNRTAIIVGAASLLLVATYPFMKRVTYWPQAVLGLTFNWGALLGWAVVHGRIDPPAIALYAAGFFWTLGYDTIYAHQDKEDDALIGVRSTALLLAGNSRIWIAGFYAAAILLLAVAGWLTYTEFAAAWPYWTALGLGALHLSMQLMRVNFDSPVDCLRKFKANRDFGIILLIGMVGASTLA